MKALVITASLQTPVVADVFLPIDGILHYYAMREQFGEQPMTLPGQVSTRATAFLPLERRNTQSPHWYFAASFAQWNGTVALGTDHWNKRFDQQHADLADFRGKRGKVIVEQGSYKAYHMPLFTRHALSVSWYVVGDPHPIERLLAHATHIGKKHAQGYGAVLRWHVAPHHADWSEYGPDGCLMRAIPSERGILTGVRPSYWLPAHQCLCQVPSYEERLC